MAPLTLSLDTAQAEIADTNCKQHQQLGGDEKLLLCTCPRIFSDKNSFFNTGLLSVCGLGGSTRGQRGLNCECVEMENGGGGWPG